MVRELGRSQLSFSSFGVTLLISAALLLSPTLIFLRFHGASLFSAHALIVAVALFGIAVAVAFVSERFASVRAPVLALLVCWFVEVQSESTLATGELAAVLVVALLGFRMLRSHWQVLGPVALVFLVASAVLPVGGGDSVPVERAPSEYSALPPVLHVVLDEQIGVEGIPREFDPTGEAVRELRDAYLSRGFRVFGRAYSRHYLSRDSFSAMFNRGVATRYTGSSRRVHLLQNEFFSDLSKRGYAIRVLQTDYLDFCVVPGDFDLTECRSVALETPAVLDEAALSVPERVRLLIGMMSRLSSRLPEFEVGRVSALAADAALDTALGLVSELQPGEALFVHVMLPHFPYAFDSSCRLRPDPSTWAYGEGAEVTPDHYSEAGRQLRYPLYLEQVRCAQRRVGKLLDALDANGTARGARVVVQGDHGSRIGTSRPSTRTAAELTPRDFSDGYSTLFAMRRPGQSAVYDRRMLPIEALLPVAFGSGVIPASEAWLQPPYVVLADRDGRAKHRLPEFERGDALGAALD